MKLGIGVRAGLSSGIIISGIYAIGIAPLYLFFYLAELGMIESSPGKLTGVGVLVTIITTPLFLFAKLAIGGYYNAVIRSPIAFLILLLCGSIIVGKTFESVYRDLPFHSSIKKGAVYSIGIWLLSGILGVIIFPQDIKDIGGHVYTIIGWLLYGFLLGKFYDAFSKEPDAGIFYMIKKVLLRKS